MPYFAEGLYNYIPEVINVEREKRILISLFWEYSSNITTISEEKLVYGSKDLLAWLGGALGIFVGYSFFDFAKHVIDVVFYFVYQVISTHRRSKVLQLLNISKADTYVKTVGHVFSLRQNLCLHSVN